MVRAYRIPAYWLAIISNALVMVALLSGSLVGVAALQVFWAQALALLVPFIYFAYTYQKHLFPESIFPWEKHLYEKPSLLGSTGLFLVVVMLAGLPFFFLAYQAFNPYAVAIGVAFALIEAIIALIRHQGKRLRNNPLGPSYVARFFPLLLVGTVMLGPGHIVPYVLVLAIVLKLGVEVHAAVRYSHDKVTAGGANETKGD